MAGAAALLMAAVLGARAARFPEGRAGLARPTPSGALGFKPIPVFSRAGSAPGQVATSPSAASATASFPTFPHRTRRIAP